MPRPIRLCLYGLWLAAIAVLFALHAVHLRADFPNQSPWMDYSKYTDEGWYGKAAIEHYVAGSWYVRGDFNPSVALPVLPALELALFRFTGVSLVAARLLVLGIFAVNLLLAYFVLRTPASQIRVSRPAALFAITLLVSNAFLYAFSRLAILEQPLALFLLASWLLALRLPGMATAARRAAALVAIGFALCLAVLTKTTGIFLVPSAVFLIWHAYGYKWKASVRPFGIVTLSATIPFAAYYLLFVRPRYAYDYHYLFAANDWNRPIGFQGYLAAFWYALHGTLWIDVWLSLLAVALLALAAIFARSPWARGLWRNPLLIASLSAVAGYVFFIGWHNNMQPRYYQVLAYSLVFMIALATQALFDAARRLKLPQAWFQGSPARSPGRPSPPRLSPAQPVSARSCTGPAIPNMGGSPPRTSSPTISTNILTATGCCSPSAETTSPSSPICPPSATTSARGICRSAFMTTGPAGMPAGTDIDPGTLNDLHTQYTLEPVAAFRAFDDPDRNQLILYKLHPLPVARQH